tara:strand:+ start:7558 stop:8100 length:543 start_codon:yes stop_codon:yes gene_type:complete
MDSLFNLQEMRDKILNGESDDGEDGAEPIKSPFQIESKDSLTILPFCLAAASFAIVGYDKLKNNGQMFDGFAPLVMMVGGFLPLGFALGRLNRGLSAQEVTSKYDTLLDNAQEALEETEAEKQEAETKAAESQKNDYRLDYLSAELSTAHQPSIFGGNISAFGQEAVSFRPNSKAHDSLW